MIHSFRAEQTDAGLNFDIRLDKNRRAYCFIGENGAGKTNLLENMAKTLIYCHSMFLKDEQDDRLYSGFYYHHGILDKIKDEILNLPSDISLNGTKISKEKWAFTYFHQISNSSTNFVFDNPLVFIGAKNRGYTNNIDTNRVRILGNSYDRFLEGFCRSFRYMSGKSPEATEIADWFSSRLIINPNFVPRHQNRAYEAAGLLMLMQELEPALKDLIVKKDGQTDVDILFSEGKLLFNKIPIDKLATGYVAVIKIFQEILAGYGGWAGISDSPPDLNNVEGLVFIDEIESHLHPKWQYRIIPLLKKSFPKTTFYIATHSPAVVSVTGEGEAYELKKTGKQCYGKKTGESRRMVSG